MARTAATWKQMAASKGGKTTQRASKVSSGQVSRAMKAYVNRRIDAAADTKETNYDSGVHSLRFANAATFSANGVFALTPYTSQITISQGTGEGDRVGDSVRVKSAKLRMVLYPNVYDATSNNLPKPQDVQVFIFGMKPQYDSYNNAVSSATTNMLQNGNSSAGLTSIMSDLLSDVNSDIVTLYSRKIYKVGTATDTGTGNQIAYQYFANNDYKYNHIIEMDLTKFYPKKLIWNDTATLTTTRGVYMVVCPVPADGTAPVSSQFTCSCEWQMNLKYKDA